MPETTPQEMLDTFSERFNAGDVEGVFALYEPDAVFVEEPGQIRQGTAAVRECVEKFIASRPKLTLVKRETVVAGDVGTNYVQWSLTETGLDGELIEMEGVAVGLVRRQPDGSWKIVIDNPWGTGVLS